MEQRKRKVLPARVGDSIQALIPRGFPIERASCVWTGVPQDDFKDFVARHPVFSQEHEDVILQVEPGIEAIGLTWGGVALWAALTAVSVGLSFAIKALTPPPKMRNRQTHDNTEGSPTYGWGPIQNTSGNGVEIPLIDGEHDIGGHRLAVWSDATDDGKHELFMMFGLGAGPIGAINGFTEDTSVFNSSETAWGEKTEYELGDIVVPSTRNRFRYSCTTAGTRSDTEPTWPTTITSTVADGTVTWTCGEGVEGLTGTDLADGLLINGTPARLYDGLRVFYRLGATDQRPIPGFNDIKEQRDIDPSAQALPYNIARTHETREQVNAIRLIIQFQQGLKALDDSGAFLQKSVKFKLRYRAVGETNWSFPQYHTFSGKTSTILTKKIEIEHLDPAVYEVELTRETADDDVYSISTANFVAAVEIRYDDVSRNGQALLGLRHIASEQLAGQLPRVTVRAHGMLRSVYQPGDEFGQDTEQDFNTGREGLLWGWHCYRGNDNDKAIEFADAHTRGERTFACKHTAADTTRGLSEPDGTLPSCPFFYKKLYGDFSLTVRCNAVGGTITPGDGMGVMFMDDEHNEHFAFGAIENVEGTTQARFHNNILDQTEDTYGSAALALPQYIKLEREDNVWTFSVSSDNSTYTEIDSLTYLPTDPVRVGLIYYSQTSTSGGLRPVFSEFEFADETCYSLETTSNPAWVVNGHMTDTFWGIGSYIPSGNIDLDTFIGFGAYARGLVSNGRGGLERRFRFDGVLDTSRGAWDSLLRILENYRATLLRQGDQYRVAWLKSIGTAPPAQMFADANTKQNTLVVTNQTPRVDANVYRIQFLDGEKEFKQSFEPYPDPDIEQGEAWRTITHQQYGIKRRSEARRSGLYKCKKARYQREAFRLETSIRAIRCEPYNVVEVSARMLGIGESGYVVSASLNTLILDKPVTLEAGYTYAAKIQHLDDTTETVTVTSDIGVREQLAVSDFTSIPQEGAVWAFGRTSILTKPYEVTKIEIRGNLECLVEGVLYEEDVYDETINRITPIKYSTLPDPRAIPDDVAIVTLTERAETKPDGSVEYHVDCTYSAAKDAVAYDIYYRNADELGWEFYETTKGTHSDISGMFVKDETYDVAVVSVGAYGAKKKPAEAADPGVPYESILIKGKVTPPDDVGSLTVVRVRNDLAFEWTPVGDDDLDAYEIRYADTDVWGLDEGAEYLLTAGSKATRASTPTFVDGVTKYFSIKALNSSRLYSTNATSVQYTIPSTAGESLDIDQYETDSGIDWNGTLVNFTKVGSQLEQDSGTTTASYTTAQLNAGSAAARRVQAHLSMTPDTPTYDLSATWTLGSDIAKSYTLGGAIEGVLSHEIQIRYGNSPLNGETYKTLIDNGWYNAQYYQIKVSVTTTSIATQAIIANIHTMIGD
jgi:predicted phage tail protein